MLKRCDIKRELALPALPSRMSTLTDIQDTSRLNTRDPANSRLHGGSTCLLSNPRSPYTPLRFAACAALLPLSADSRLGSDTQNPEWADIRHPDWPTSRITRNRTSYLPPIRFKCAPEDWKTNLYHSVVPAQDSTWSLSL